MRLPRTTRLAVGITALALALAGCGGAQVTVNEVPGGPVDLKTPGSGEGFAAAATATATATPTPTETPAEGTAEAAPTATAVPDTTTPDATGTQADPNGGAAAPADDGTGAAQPPDPGASKDEFEDYCAQNPGAC
jgi:hypothetical protein